MTTLPPPTPRQVLVVDDGARTRTQRSAWLRSASYDVHEAGTGQAALEILGQHPVDLVLLDVDLPDMDGHQVCEYIKTSRATSAIPVVYVSTSSSGSQDRIAGFARGAEAFLAEPIAQDELLATVNALLRYHDARRTAELRATRLERLHQATLLMNAASTVSELAQVASNGLLTLFGFPVGVFLTRDGRGRLATAAPNDREPFVRPWPSDRILELAEAARDTEEVDIDRLPAAFSASSGASASRATRGGAGTAVATPITTPRGELVGVVALLAPAISAEDALLLDHFAQALAVALENQRLLDVEHRIALTLQRAMLPQTLPATPGLEVAVTYQAASDTVEIGGDFYEVLQMGPETTMLVIGDVAGHSLHAATVMAELRHSLRAFASLGMAPPDIIDRLSALLIDNHPDLIATLCIAVVDLGAGEVRVNNAGHVPPLIRCHGVVRSIDEHGALLGLRSPVGTPTVTMEFPPGAVLVMATDGLIERPREDLALGLQRLNKAILAHEGGPQALCRRVIDDVTEGLATLDDIAVVVARRAG